ncbi:MAG: hypothetical protein SVW57_15495 [Thermodesulfobacteriota bacterium]|nr:hypothetical protein [Thermodesulfobacteriota bacterium]
MKVRLGATSIQTDKERLNIFHGVFKTIDGAIYRLRVALHNLENPARIL